MKRVRKEKEEDGPKKKYASTKLAPDTRTGLAYGCMAVEELGVTREDYRKSLKNLGIDVPKSTLNDWISKCKEQGAAVSLVKAAGRPAALEEDEIRVFCGYVLYQNENNEEVHLEDAQTFLLDTFGKKLALSTIFGYLEECGFSSKTTQNKTSGYFLSGEKQADLMFEWLSQMRKGPFFDVKDEDIGSMDFTFTGHRSDRRITYSPKGGAQPQNAKKISRFTNCILTCVWADGGFYTPCLLFTHNPKFKQVRKHTKKNDEEVKYFLDMCKKYKIDPDRIFYIKEEDKSSTYAAESGDFVKEFFKKYDNLQDACILSDNGKAFQKVFEKAYIAEHRFYPAAVHQFLSPNDNKLHGEAKAKWRAEKNVDFSDDVKSCLSLMNHLDLVDKKHIKGWFKKSLQLHEKNITREACVKMLGRDSTKHSKFHHACLREYHVYLGEDSRGDEYDSGDELHTGLDGGYWSW